MTFLRSVLWETAAVGALGAVLLADTAVASAARRGLLRCLGESPPQLVWVVLAFFSWACGRMNSSLAVLLVSVLPLISVVQSSFEGKAATRAAFKSAAKQGREGGAVDGHQDSAKAFGNAVIGAMWGDLIGPVVADRVKRALNSALSKRTFPALRALEVKQCHFGENAPELRTCEASITGDGALKIMGKMDFQAGHDFVVQLKARWARKLESLPPLAIHITGVRVSGSVLIRASKFTSEKPHVQHMSFSFIEAPKISFNIEPMGKRSLDITLLPGMSAWLDKVISSGLERHAVWPKSIVVDSQKGRRDDPVGGVSEPQGAGTPDKGDPRGGAQEAMASPRIDFAGAASVEAELEAELTNLKDGGAVSLFSEGEQKIIMEGWLQKEGAKVKSVKRRYFCLLRGSLLYYDDDTRKVCRGEISLSPETKVIAMEHNRRRQLQSLCSFAVTHGLHNREKIILASEDGEEGRKSWIKQIRLAANPQPSATSDQPPETDNGAGEQGERAERSGVKSRTDTGTSLSSASKTSEYNLEAGRKISSDVSTQSIAPKLPSSAETSDAEYRGRSPVEKAQHLTEVPVVETSLPTPVKSETLQELMVANEEWREGDLDSSTDSEDVLSFEPCGPVTTRSRSAGLPAGLHESPMKLKTDAKVLLEGWLLKRGKAMKSVRRRYFVLDDEFLRYFESESKATCKGEISLSAQSRVLTANTLNGAPAFAVTYGPGDDMIVLAAESPQERQEWIESLRGQVKRMQEVELLPGT